MRRDKGKRQQIIEGELSSLIVFSERRHVEYIYPVLDEIETMLKETGYRVCKLGDEIRSGQNYLNKLEELVDNCVFGIILLDGLRPNVLFEFGFLLGKQKPCIILQSQNAYVCIKTLYKDYKGSGLNEIQFNKKLLNPSLDLQVQLSDLGGRHILFFDQYAGKTQDLHIRRKLSAELDKLRDEVSKETKKVITKRTKIGGEMTLNELVDQFTRASVYKDTSGYDINKLKNAYDEIKKR